MHHIVTGEDPPAISSGEALKMARACAALATSACCSERHIGLVLKAAEVIGWEGNTFPSTSTVWGIMGTVLKSGAGGNMCSKIPFALA